MVSADTAMISYPVSFTQPAELDLFELYEYLSDTAKQPQTAYQIYKQIKLAVSTLASMPNRHPIVNELPYKSLGVRRMIVKNYSIFYISNDHQVTILRILYTRREWPDFL